MSTKQNLTLDTLLGVVNTGEEEVTSSVPDAPVVKVATPPKTPATTGLISESKQLSVRIDGSRYDRLKAAALLHKLSHRDIMVQGLDLWLKKYGQ